MSGDRAYLNLSAINMHLGLHEFQQIGYIALGRN